MPRTYTFRTLRSDFIDMCDGDRTAAMALDYFWQQGQKIAERQSQGYTDSAYIPLGWNYGLSVILLEVSKNSLKRAITLLIAKGYITPHPRNGQVELTARNEDRVNRYRVNVPIIQAAINQWSGSTEYVPADPPRSVQTYGYIPTDPPGISVQTHGVGPYGPQDVVKESVLESAAAAKQPLPPPIEKDKELRQILGAYLNRVPTPLELQRTSALVEQYGYPLVSAAIEDAAAKGGRSVRYVEQIAHNANPRQPAPASGATRPEHRYYVPDAPDEPLITAEEARALRLAARNGGA